MKHDRWRRVLLAAGGLAAGCATMYYLDPQRGKRRRAFVRDQGVHAAHAVANTCEKAGRDFAHRTAGILAGMKCKSEGIVSDDVLLERVRSAVGHAVDASKLEISVTNGTVIVAGRVPSAEAKRLLKKIWSIHGVRGLDASALTLEDGSSGSSTLRQRPVRWTPAKQAIVGAGGAFASAGAIAIGGAVGVVLGVSGAAAMIRAISNRPLSSIVGRNGRAAAIDVQKTINIHVPVAQVFDFWADPLNYPKALAHVVDVSKTGFNRYRWHVAGPAGTEVKWEGRIVRLEANKLLEWASFPDSMVRNEGTVRLDSNDDGSTTVHVRLHYIPPVGLLGHFVAELFRADPKNELHSDLARLKTMFEQGELHVRAFDSSQYEIDKAVGGITASSS